LTSANPPCGDDGYTPTPLPNFIRVSMGDAPLPDRRPRPPHPDAARPDVRPLPTDPRPDPPGSRDDRLAEKARAVVRLVVTLPLWFASLFIIVSLFLGTHDDDPIVVNDEPGCGQPTTIAASELGRSTYWEACDDDGH
jgi:hypothetical protein